MATSGNTHLENIRLNTGICDSGSVAIIIVNYYSADLLKRCLSCVAGQLAPPGQVVIVDNGDEKDGLNFIEESYPDFQLIRLDNIGFAAANNLALRQVRDSEWIVLLNPDAFPEPDWLSNLLDAAGKNPVADVFSSHLVMDSNPMFVDGDGDSYHFTGWAGRRNHGRPESSEKEDCWVFSPCAAAAMYRRNALLEIGGFDETYFCYFEDVDLGFRLRLLGHHCLHVSKAVVSHVGGSSSEASEMSDFALYHGHRNLVWTFVKNMPGYLFWLFLPAHIVMNIVAVMWFAAHGKARVIVRAKTDAIRRLPEVWRQRKRIQAERTIKPHELLGVLSFWPRR